MTMFHRRGGFTLIELVLFAGIFSIAVVVFVTILITITRIQVRQMSVSEVTQQSQLILQTIQNYVESSRNIEMTTDQATTTLRLRMEPSSADPTLIYLSGTVMYVKQSSSAPIPLTSNRVSVSNVAFTKRANPGGRDSVSTAFTVSYNTSNVQQQFVQALQTAVSRVNAATFDSDIRASSSNTYKIGAAAQEWQSINNTIFFGSAGNIGIGGNQSGSSTVMLKVYNGNIQLQDDYGIILKNSGSGNCYLLRVTAAGVPTTTSIGTCP